MFRLAVIGMEHGHYADLFPLFLAEPDVELLGFADPNPAVREWHHRRFDVGPVYSDEDELLEKGPNIVLCCSENSRHPDITAKAARIGAHVMVEKPMADCYAGALHMKESAERAGVALMCNWPTYWSPGVRWALSQVSEGLVGRVIHCRFRGAHNGPDQGIPESILQDYWFFDPIRGGGVLLDYCCYGASLAQSVFGSLPTSVMASCGRYAKDACKAEDNALVVAEYAAGFALCEGSWTHLGNAPRKGLVVQGTRGTIEAADGEVKIWRIGEEPKTVAPPPLAAGDQNGPAFFLSHLRSGRAIGGPCGAEESLAAQAILEAGRVSIDTGRRVLISEVLSRGNHS